MGDGRPQRAFEAAIEAIAAACLAAAVAFAIFKLGGEGREALVAAVATGALTFVFARRALHHVGGESRPFAVPDFTLAELGPGWAAVPDELLLTADMAVTAPDDEALLLDDVLAELAPDSRVVRLFEPAAIPTAGELRARIDRHLHGAAEQAPPDASADLHLALDVLRRSLR